DINIPIFRANLMLVTENIYDVTALSPKMFIFNNELILQPLFPTEIIRLGIKD
ncbi:CDI toxin immunity protein, partial [Serratia sarumanii]